MNSTATCFAFIVLCLVGSTLSAPAVKVDVTVVSTAPVDTSSLAPGTTTTTAPELTTTPCGDQLTNCSQYQAECTQPDYQATMYKFCRKTCGMCNL
uniref:ShKT domain-containing protein n=1 Tax=Panagrellus redivivus TaxID=6233 RepID=A0A7E4V001_PANRE